MAKSDIQYWLPYWGYCAQRDLRIDDTLKRLGCDRNTWIFVNSWGSADIYQMVSLMGDFIKYHCTHGEKIIIVLRETYKEIPILFSQFADKIRIVTAGKEQMDSIVGELSMQRDLVCGVPMLFIPTHWGNGDLQRLYYLRGISVCELFKYMLHIPFDSKPAKPVLPLSYRKSAYDKLGSVFDPARKSVLLCPSSVTLKPFPDAFWEAIAERLKGMGYRVFCDTANGKNQPLKGTEELCFTFGEAVTVAETIGHVISHQSGLTHLLSSSTCKLTIFYPGPLPSARYGVPFSAVSLHNGGFRDTEEAVEIPEDASVEDAVEKAMAALTPIYA